MKTLRKGCYADEHTLQQLYTCSNLCQDLLDHMRLIDSHCAVVTPQATTALHL